MASLGLSELKLLVSDVDGTLVRPDKSLAPVTLEAVSRLHEAGIHFTLISARPPRALQHLVNELGIDVPFGAFNGGNIVSAEGEVLSRNQVPREAVVKALQGLAGEPVEVWLYADDLWLTMDPNGAYVPKETHTLGYGPTIVESFEPYMDRVDKIVAASAASERLVELETALSTSLAGLALAVRSQTYYLDVTALSANKGDGLAALAKHVGVSLAQTAAIGDGHNDIAMFNRAGVSIAMGQGAKEVLEQATYITSSNAEDGLAAAIDRFILPAVHVQD